MATTYVDIHFPDAAAIDYTDIDEVAAYFALWNVSYQCVGGYAKPMHNSAYIRTLEAQAQYWMKKVEEILTYGPLTAIPKLLDAYGAVYRMFNGTEPLDFKKKLVAKAVNRWLGGEKTINTTDVVLLIESVIETDYMALENKYVQYALSVEESWVDELQCYCKFREVDYAEAYRRLAFLMAQDLFVYSSSSDPEEKMKRRWAKAYIVDDTSELDTDTLQEYIAFLYQVYFRKILTFPEPAAMFTSLQSELHAREDLHPFHRDALKLKLHTYSEIQPN